MFIDLPVEERPTVAAPKRRILNKAAPAGGKGTGGRKAKDGGARTSRGARGAAGKPAATSRKSSRRKD